MNDVDNMFNRNSNQNYSEKTERKIVDDQDDDKIDPDFEGLTVD